MPLFAQREVAKMAPNYNTLPTQGHIVGRASEKNSTAWRVIAAIVAYVVEVKMRGQTQAMTA